MYEKTKFVNMKGATQKQILPLNVFDIFKYKDIISNLILCRRTGLSFDSEPSYTLYSSRKWQKIKDKRVIEWNFVNNYIA